MRSPAELATGLGPLHPAASCRLPVSGLAVDIRHPTGREDMLLLETAAGSAESAVMLAQRLGRTADGGSVAWQALPITDLDAFVLSLRQALISDWLTADVRCRAANCGSRIEISFSISAYLDHHQPKRGGYSRRGWSLSPKGDELGWFRMTPGAAETVPELHFRLPAVGDELAVADSADGEEQLARRCIRPGDVPRRLRRIVEAAMEAMAPPLAGDLEGVCPECGSRVMLYFDPRQFCLQELRNRAAFVYEDIDVLARRYCWSERAILAMPNSRRTSYAELARQNRNA
jgi:hypothetical protein